MCLIRMCRARAHSTWCYLAQIATYLGLRELEQQSTVEASGSIPRQTAASVTSLEARKAELASETPTEKAPDVSEPAGSPKDIRG